MCAPSPPPPPDYAAIAQQQGAANIDAARVTASLNNPNIINPYGTQTVEYGKGATLDQAAYDKAMADYQASLSAFNSYSPASSTPSANAPAGAAPGTYGYVWNPGGSSSTSVAAPAAPAPVKPTMPNQEDFMVGGNKDQATVTQTFAPEQQKLFDQSNLNKGLLGDLTTQGIQSLQGTVGTPLNLSGVAGAPTAYQPGGLTPSGTPQALNPNGLPSMPGRLDLNSLSPQGQVLDGSGLPAMPQASQAIRDQVIDAIMSRVNTDTNLRRDDKNSTLIAAGVRPGARAYGSEMDQIDRGYNDARMQAIIAGGNAAQQQYNMDLSTRQQGVGEQAQTFGQAQAARLAGMTEQQAQAARDMIIRGQAVGEQQQQFSQELAGGNQSFQQQLAALQQGQSGQAQQFSQQDALRRQQIAEILAQRQTPLNEVSALMGGSQVTNPFASGIGYQGGASTQPAPIMNAAQAAAQAQQAQYAQQVGSSNSMMSGLFGLGSAFLGSDRRLKKNIVRIGTHKLGIGLYEWDYLWDEHSTGVMADELEEVMPQAVKDFGGYKFVNYAMIGA